MVSHRGFRRFFSYIGQGKVTTKDIPDRHTVATKAQKLSAEAKEKIKKEIKVRTFHQPLGYVLVVDVGFSTPVEGCRVHPTFGQTKLNALSCASQHTM